MLYVGAFERYGHSLDIYIKFMAGGTPWCINQPSGGRPVKNFIGRGAVELLGRAWPDMIPLVL